MTAPVKQSKDNNEWNVSFVLPSKYNLENVPKPKDNRINIYEQKESIRAVIRFSGFWTESNLNKHKEKLEKYIKDNGLTVKSEVIYAFYNSPYWIPFFRRNEVMYIIE
jgi:predicted nuclease of restriction endonuclease-like RecB superfamily